ncbi:hypothetical protein HK104_007460 [Borealophlyctis nickersoniae]|nr:hypothetical protein HK104_007460 [Borealophlyctis nickersoniae]
MNRRVGADEKRGREEEEEPEETRPKKLRSDQRPVVEVEVPEKVRQPQGEEDLEEAEKEEPEEEMSPKKPKSDQGPLAEVPETKKKAPTLTTVPRDVVLEIGEYLERKDLIELSHTSKGILSHTLLRAKWDQSVKVYIGHKPTEKWAPRSNCVQWNAPLPDGKANSHLVRRLRIDSDADIQTIVAALPDVASMACLCSGVRLLFITFPGIVYRQFREVAGLFRDIVRSMPELGALVFEADPNFDPNNDVDLCQPMTAGPSNSILEIAPYTLRVLAFHGFEPVQHAQLARFRNLKDLVLPPTQRIDAALLETLETHCPCLIALHVRNIYRPPPGVVVGGTFTAGLLNLLPRLRGLTLFQRHLPPSDVETIISRALTSCKFDELRLWNCLFDPTYDETTNPNTVFAVQHLLRRTLSPQLSSTPISLTKLNLSSVPLSLDTYNTLSSGYFPKLEELGIISYYHSCGAIRISQRSARGRALKTCEIQDETIEATATFDHVVAIVMAAPELEYLYLGRSERPEMRVGRRSKYVYDLKWMRKALTEVRAAGLEGAEMLAEMERKWAAVKGESDPGVDAQRTEADAGAAEGPQTADT